MSDLRSHSLPGGRARWAVLASVVAVAAVAVAVPLLRQSGPTAPVSSSGPTPSATASAPAAGASPSATAQPGSGALDPARPWAYRGQGSVLAEGTLETARREWAAAHPGSRLEPLYGWVYEPSALPELVFVAHGGGPARYGLMTFGEGGPEVLVDAVLPTGARAVPIAVAGDEVSRLIVVSAPGTTSHYARNGEDFERMTSRADGVGISALDGDRERDRLQVRDRDGRVVASQSAPDPKPGEPGGHGGSALPGNVLDWPARGAESDVVDDMHRAYARSRGDGAPETSAQVLFASDDDAGTTFVLAQMWVPGDEAADTVGYVTSPYRPAELQLKARLTKDAAVVAMLVPRSRGQQNDTLVVVPRPGAGQVEYAADGRSFRRVGESQDYLDGVVLVDRTPTADADRVRVLDGNGRVLFEGAVSRLLCGAKGCG